MGSARYVAATAPLVGVEGFIEQGVHDRPGDIGVTGGVGARSAVGDLAAGGGAALDGQERLGDVGPAGVPLDAAALDRVLGLEDQQVLGLKAVMDRRGFGVEVAHQVEHAIAHTGDVDADVLHVEALGKLFDLGGLVVERMPPPAVLFQDAEFRPGFQRRCDHHAGGVVAGAAWVVAQPDRTVAERPIQFRVVVFPQRQVGVAALQILEAEGALAAIDEFAIEQLLEFVFVVLQLQLLQVEQIAAAIDRVLDGDGLAPLAIGAQCALRVRRLGGPGAAGFLAAFAVAELFPRPERVRLVRHCAGRREVGFTPLLVGAHGAGHGAEFFEVADPEILIHVHMAMVALGGAAVGRQEAQFGAVAERDRVAGQLDVKPLFGELDDVAAEDLRLRAAGR